MRRRNGGFTIIELLVTTVIAGAVLLSVFYFQGIVTRNYHSTDRRSEIEALRWTVLGNLSCKNTLAATGGLCPPTITLRTEKKNQVLIEDSGTRFGYWTLQGICDAGRISVRYAALRSDGTFDEDPLLKTPLSWKPLFPAGTSPCELAEPVRLSGPQIIGADKLITIPEDVRSVMIEAWGGGGGGGGSDGCSTVCWTKGADKDAGVGNGGGGAAYSKAILPVKAGAQYQIVIGRGGHGGRGTNTTVGTCNHAPGAPGTMTTVTEVASGTVVISAAGGGGGQQSIFHNGATGRGGAATTAPNVLGIAGSNGGPGRGCASGAEYFLGGPAAPGNRMASWAIPATAPGWPLGVAPGVGGNGGGVYPGGGRDGRPGADGQVVVWYPP